MKDQDLLNRVVNELVKRGFEVSKVGTRAEADDLFVRRADRITRVRVKATRKPTGWLLNAPRANDIADNLVYLFIDPGDDDIKYWVVPSSIVAEYVAKRHDAWLKKPGHRGQSHNDSGIRYFDDPEHQYFDAWTRLDGL